MFKKAFLVCKAEGRITTGPKAKVGIQLQVILQYLRGSDDYWEQRLATTRPPKSLKWEGIYKRAWDLIREKELGDGKTTPQRLDLSERTPSFYNSSGDETTRTSPVKANDQPLRSSLLDDEEEDDANEIADQPQNQEQEQRDPDMDYADHDILEAREDPQNQEDHSMDAVSQLNYQLAVV